MSMFKIVLLLLSLDSPSFGVRQQAENALMRIRPSVALLQVFRDNGSAEVRFRVGRIAANLYPPAERLTEPTEVDPMPPAAP